MAGRVTGCVAEGENGLVRYVASKGVVLATGDFSQDRDMVAKGLQRTAVPPVLAGPMSWAWTTAARSAKYISEELMVSYNTTQIFAANSFRLDQDKWWLVYDESGNAMNWLMDKVEPYSSMWA